MTRHHNMLVAAVFSVAVGGCAMLVQFGGPEGQAAGGYESVTSPPGSTYFVSPAP